MGFRLKETMISSLAIHYVTVISNTVVIFNEIICFLDFDSIVIYLFMFIVIEADS